MHTQMTGRLKQSLFLSVFPLVLTAPSLMFALFEKRGNLNFPTATSSVSFAVAIQPIVARARLCQGTLSAPGAVSHCLVYGLDTGSARASEHLWRPLEFRRLGRDFRLLKRPLTPGPSRRRSASPRRTARRLTIALGAATRRRHHQWSDRCAPQLSVVMTTFHFRALESRVGRP